MALRLPELTDTDVVTKGKELLNDGLPDDLTEGIRIAFAITNPTQKIEVLRYSVLGALSYKSSCAAPETSAIHTPPTSPTYVPDKPSFGPLSMQKLPFEPETFPDSSQTFKCASKDAPASPSSSLSTSGAAAHSSESR